MVTKEDYLKAKSIVKEYEFKNKKVIGIVCLNISDYNEYIKNLKLDDLCKYIKIRNLADLCSWTLDNYIETDHAKENKQYNEIINQIIKFNLKK
jgi:hypothetical protein